MSGTAFKMPGSCEREKSPGLKPGVYLLIPCFIVEAVHWKLLHNDWNPPGV